MRPSVLLCPVAVLLAVGPLAGAAELPPPELTVTTVTDELPGGVGGVAVDKLGLVWVADFGERLWKVDPGGEVTVQAASLYGSSGNAVDASGAVYQSSFYGGTVSRIGRDGTVATWARGLEGPVGVSVADDGSAVVCECRANRLARLAPDGTVSGRASSELLNCPNGITRTPDERLFVVNFSDGRVLELGAEGTVSELATIPTAGNGHLTWGAGALWVASFRANRIFRVGLDGAVTAVAGSGRFESTDGVGLEASFSNPNGIAYDAARDALYVNDYLTPFLQRTSAPKRSLLRRIAFPSLTARLRQALQAGGVEALRSAYHEYKDARPGRFTEIEVNVLGYTLLGEHRTDAAIAVLELNTEDYPASANTWDSLAEAWMTAGDRERAIRFYRKSLELNPGNANARDTLAELGAE